MWWKVCLLCREVIHRHSSKEQPVGTVRQGCVTFWTPLEIKWKIASTLTDHLNIYRMDIFLYIAVIHCVFVMKFILGQAEELTKLPVCMSATLCRVPLESPKKAMLCPSLTLTATAVRRAAEVCHTASASSTSRLAIGLGVWSEPQGYAFRVFYEM